MFWAFTLQLRGVYVGASWRHFMFGGSIGSLHLSFIRTGKTGKYIKYASNL